EIFIIMGGSGCGKSSLLRHLIGLQQPRAGEIFLFGKNLNRCTEDERNALRQRIGVMYQGGALWSSMTLLENVMLPLEEFSKLNTRERREVARYKLALVGLEDAADKYPAEISGGMAKRASIARAIALDPEILFFDEPGAGLDPIASKELDDLTLNIRDALGTTIVIVTHELDSIFAVGDRALFLDSATKTAGALGDPRELRETAPADIRYFLSRAGTLPGAKHQAPSIKPNTDLPSPVTVH
ncbi:MAG: ATP-binding cassette domain-containing protein, partial [Opitutales bacterium]|nr:ATP-binding cassette domain-containing protein [Opitutales bacterium]